METTVLIVGAGPAGLAMSVCLSNILVSNIMLEKEDCHASLWKRRSYNRLHLHLAKEFCELPYMPHLPETPTFMPKETFIDYMDKYVRDHHLKSLLGKLEKNNILRQQVKQALDVPLHWRMRRIENRNFINIYQRDDSHNKAFLDLAISDYNLVQSVYQRELKELSRCRKGLTKVTSFITTIDDVYDIYGTLDELQLFTEAIERWDVNAVKDLPYYMKLSFLALYNTVNEMAYDTLKDNGEIIIPHLAKAWGDLCKAFLQEAKWAHNKSTPSFEEYIENGWRSVSGTVILILAFIPYSITINS
ncbi:hypothetical protein JCGZ_03551 [Jatropha curcas]|uniref:Terpene synthase metal-binding domain-containing protein n=1 Tax=Jatropha curcas TaxID=180498 RepID=A0A067LA82_JATCU|nr:hypothetical protein JCGZ_03551 [Jatropha curcas]